MKAFWENDFQHAPRLRFAFAVDIPRFPVFFNFTSFESGLRKDEWMASIVPIGIIKEVSKVELIPFRVSVVAIESCSWRSAALKFGVRGILRPYPVWHEDPSVGLAIDVEPSDLCAWCDGRGFSVEMIVGGVSFQLEEDSREIEIIGRTSVLSPSRHAAM